MKGALKFLYKSSRTSHALKIYMKYNIMFFLEHKTEKMQKVVQKKNKKYNARIHFRELYPELIDKDRPYLMLKI